MSETSYESRHGTDREDDIAEYVPESADPMMGEDHPRPGDKQFGNLYVDEDALYSTGVHCTRCYCQVAVIEDGVTHCPNCGWRSDGGHKGAEDLDWQERADQLVRHGVPEQRAKIVALADQGHSHAEIADELGLESRGSVYNQIESYRSEDKPNAEWLAEYGPEV